MKTIKFYKNGNSVRVFDYDSEQIVDKLSPAIYTVQQDMAGFYLSFVSDKFDIPRKLYGSCANRAEKILNTYDDRNKSTGVLLSGDKGSGKTMLSSLVSNMMIDRGVPVILIENCYAGTNFISFLNNLGETVLFFDEFAKVFSTSVNPHNGVEESSQDELLTIFDGANSMKRLILLTENDTYGINSYMLNRPGRIFYHFKYKKLEEGLVREFCGDMGVPDNIVSAILSKIDCSREFSFDALKAVVEEYTRYKEDIKEIFDNLNIENMVGYSKKFKLLKLIESATNRELTSTTKEITMVGDYDNIYVYYNSPNGSKKSSDLELFDEQRRSALFKVEDIVKKEGNKVVYESKSNGLILVLEEQPEDTSYRNYSAYLS